MKTKLFLLAGFLVTNFINAQWTQVGEYIHGEGEGDRFGTAISLSSDGTIIAVGSAVNDTNGFNSGQVKVYKNESGTLTQIGEDFLGEAEYDELGEAVSLNGDGSMIAIGVPNNDENGDDSGVVRFYKNESDIWTQMDNDIHGEIAGEYFGSSVSLSNDGSVVVVGNGDNESHIRVYKNESNSWTKIADFVGGKKDGHIDVMCLSGDGNTLAIRGPYNEETDINPIRIYKNISGIWTLIGENIQGEIPGYSSFSVSLNNDGSILAIGEPFYYEGENDYSGVVKVYKYESGEWAQIGNDIYGTNYNSDFFGEAVSLSGDGSTLAISNDVYYSNNLYFSGQVRVYKNMSDTWTELGGGFYGDDYDRLGHSLSLNNDGSVLAFGVPGDGFFSYSNTNGYVGVYSFDMSLTTRDIFSNEIVMYKSSDSQITIIGIQGKGEIKLYSIVGKEVYNSTIQSNGLTKIDLPVLSKGIYIVKLKSEVGEKTKKIILK